MKTALFVIALSGLCVRAQPSTEAPVVAIEPFATQVEGIVEDGWLEAENGYMKAEWLSEDDPRGESLGEWRITAYYETGCATASGKYPEVNVTVAHNSLPFGTQIYVEGLGVWTVEDRGPASMGTEWCDLYLGDYSTCVQFGETFREVWLIGGGSDD